MSERVKERTKERKKEKKGQTKWEYFPCWKICDITLNWKFEAFSIIICVCYLIVLGAQLKRKEN